ncbi:hypothetical protein D3C72_1401700 [compost metagenome]
MTVDQDVMAGARRIGRGQAGGLLAVRGNGCRPLLHHGGIVEAPRVERIVVQLLQRNPDQLPARGGFAKTFSAENGRAIGSPALQQSIRMLGNGRFRASEAVQRIVAGLFGRHAGQHASLEALQFGSHT